MAGSIFISYRRDDAPGDARSIRDRLARRFGEANVFMDVDNLLAGQRFDRELDKALARCDVLIAVIGARWLDLVGAKAKSDDRDYVREEVAGALKRGIVVIPALVGREGAMPSLPRKDELPEELRELVLHQKQNVSHEHFGRDMDVLIEAIRTVRQSQRPPMPRKTIWLGAAIALVLVIGGVVLFQIPMIEQTARSTTAQYDESAVVAKRKAEEAAATQRRADTEAEAAKRKADADTARKKAEDEAAKKRADELAAKQKADQEAARRKAEDAKKSEEIYRKGNDQFTVRNFIEARKLYEQAAALDNTNAMYSLGLLYYYGYGVKTDHAESGRWFERSAKLGNFSAMNFLGLLYEYGWGVTQDLAEARKWLQKAADAGDNDAKQRLKALSR